MEACVPLCGRPLQNEALEVRIGLALIGERGVAQETEAAVIGRTSQKNASCGHQFSQAIQSVRDQCTTDALALHPWRDRDGPEPVPVAGLVVDTNRGEGDMANQLAFSG